MPGRVLSFFGAASPTRDFAAWRGCVLAAYLIVLVVVVLITYADAECGRDLPQCPHVAAGRSRGRGRVDSAVMAGKIGDGCDIHHTPPELGIGALKTGDLLFLSYEGIRVLFAKAFYGSSWTHAAMVWVDPASHEKYVLELAAYNAPYNSSAIRVPLLYWLKINRSSRAVGLLPISRALDWHAVDRAFSFYERRDIGVEGLKPTWTRFLHRRRRDELDASELYAAAPRQPAELIRCAPSPILDLADWVPAPEYWKPRSSTLYGPAFQYCTTCHEMIIDVLQQCGAVSPALAPTSFLPSEIAARKLDFTNGYTYGAMEHVSIRNANVMLRLH
jgi:hypothetical protein